MLPIPSINAFFSQFNPPGVLMMTQRSRLNARQNKIHTIRDAGLLCLSVKASGSHRGLDSTPDLFHSLTVSPSLLSSLALTVRVDTNIQHTSTPTFDGVRQKLITPANVDTQGMAKELRWLTPLIALELPRLTSCKDGDNAIPVIGLEVIRRLDKDESQRTGRFYGWHDAIDVEDVQGGRSGRGRRCVDAVHEERLDVRQAKKRRR